MKEYSVSQKLKYLINWKRMPKWMREQIDRESNQEKQAYEDPEAILGRIRRNHNVILYVRITTLVIIVSLTIVKYLIIL